MRRRAILLNALLTMFLGRESATLAENADVDSEAQMLQATAELPKYFHLRVVAWNLDVVDPAASKRIPTIAKWLKPLAADVVMVSEIRGYWNSDDSGDVSNLASLAGFPFYQYYHVTNTGLSGSKGVAVLSRYPISRIKNHPAPRRTIPPGVKGGQRFVFTWERDR